jgi:hypothetical protein
MKRLNSLIVFAIAILGFLLAAAPSAHAADTTIKMCSSAGSADAGRVIESRVPGVANLTCDSSGCVNFDITTDSAGRGLDSLYKQGFVVQNISIAPTLGVAGTTSGTLTIANSTGSGTYSLNSAANTTTYTETAKAAVPAQGDILDYSNGTGQRSSLVDVAVGQVLTSGGVGAVPVYSGSPTLSGTLTVQGATTTIGVPATTSGSLVLSNATGSGTYSLAQAPSTTTYTETTKATAPAQGDILDYSNATGQRSSLVDVAVGQVLTSGGVGAVPVYSASPTLTALTLSGTADETLQLTQGAHITSLLGSASLPTVGTGTVTAGGTDTAMQVTGATSPVTVTFTTTFHAKPICVCSNESTAAHGCGAVANSNGQTVVVTTAGTDTFDMICMGK